MVKWPQGIDADMPKTFVALTFWPEIVYATIISYEEYPV